MSKIIQKRTTKKRKTTTVANFSVKKISVGQEIKNSLWLYNFVYSSKISLCVVFLLFVSFSLQNVDRAFAADEEKSNSETLVETTVSTEMVTDNLPINEKSSQALVNDLVREEQPTETQEILISGIASSSKAKTENNSLDSIASTSILNISSSTANLLKSTSTQLSNSLNNSSSKVSISSDNKFNDINNLSTTTVLIISESKVPDEQLPENDDLNEVMSLDSGQNDFPENPSELRNELDTNIIVDSQAPSTTESELVVADEVIEEIPLEDLITNNESVSVTNSDSEFSFSKNECTQLASGSFYCRTPNPNQLKDALFSAPDEDGDLEIFIVRDGQQVQVTSNQMDDAAPYFDQNSNTIVWHRLVDDRFQIISFDVESGEETKITNTSENNMEPTRQGDYTVWQRWIDGGWNIILFNGKTETQITKNTDNNVAPYIHGSLVVWNSRDQAGDKTIEMYDIQSKAYLTVDDPDGMSVSNPRMVFVFDSLHPNGDIVTRGYDVMAHKFIDLDSLPRELPEELPESDSTGETRALIQSKPSVKSEVEELVTSTSTNNALPPKLPDMASSTGLGTLDLSISQPITETLATSSINTVLQPQLPDLATSTDSLTLDLSINTNTVINTAEVAESMIEQNPVVEPMLDPINLSEATTTETVQE